MASLRKDTSARSVTEFARTTAIALLGMEFVRIAAIALLATEFARIAAIALPVMEFVRTTAIVLPAMVSDRRSRVSEFVVVGFRMHSVFGRRRYIATVFGSVTAPASLWSVP